MSKIFIRITLFVNFLVLSIALAIATTAGDKKMISDKAPLLVVREYFESINSNNLEQYLNLLYGDDYQYIGSLFSSENKYLVSFKTKEENEIFKNIFNGNNDMHISYELRQTEDFFVVEGIYRIRFCQMFEKSKEYEEGSFDVQGKMIFCLERNEHGELKIKTVKDIPITTKKSNEVSVLFSFIKYRYSSNFYTSVDMRHEKTRDREAMVKKETYYDSKSKKQMFYLIYIEEYLKKNMINGIIPSQIKCDIFTANDKIVENFYCNE